MKKLIFILFFLCQSVQAESTDKKYATFEQWLKDIAVSTEVVDRYIRNPNYTKFDEELGYVPINHAMKGGGMDGSTAIGTRSVDGSRTPLYSYPGKKNRINTYGDSYTESFQVNDGETWQEYLSSHIREPIKNFGAGGYGVYQAYLRMLREESTAHEADYIILYVWGDDSIRSLLSNSYPLNLARFGQKFSSDFLENGARPHVELDLNTGSFVEKSNIFSKETDLYKMTDPEWMARTFRNDLALQLATYKLGTFKDLDKEKINKLASKLDYPFDWNAKDLNTQAEALLDRYAQRSTIFIINKAKDFCEKRGKKLTVILFGPDRVLPDIVQGRPRPDQEIVDYLLKEKISYIDMNNIHIEDFKKYRISYEDYMKQFFVGGNGHYNPRGNHFFAYSIKDSIINLMNPKPETYLNINPKK